MNRLHGASSWIGAGILGVSCWLLSASGSGSAADGKAPTLPDADYARTLEPSVKLVVEALGGEVTRRSADKARLAMLMLAEFAQQNLSGQDAAQRATLRDAALEVAAGIKNKNYKAAVEQAKALSKLSVNKDAKKVKVKLVGPLLDIDELMGQFRQPGKGGLGIEDLLDKLEGNANSTLPAAVLDDDLRMAAYRTAVVAELCQDHLPPQKRPLWQKHSEEMQKQALKLAGAVQAKDGKAAYQALEKLNGSCKDCHRDFR